MGKDTSGWRVAAIRVDTRHSFSDRRKVRSGECSIARDLCVIPTFMGQQRLVIVDVKITLFKTQETNLFREIHTCVATGAQFP